MYGWTKATAEAFSKWLNIELVFEGSGSTVQKQDVRANTAIKDIKKNYINFRRLICLFPSVLEL